MCRSIRIPEFRLFAALPETVPTGITTYLYGAVQSTHISINCARFLQKGRGGLFRSDGHSLVCEKKNFFS